MTSEYGALFGKGALSGKSGAICDELQKRLVRGHYRFGQEILVNDLVKEFGASRAPVMAALNFLRAEGFLVITPQVGCKVILPELSELEDFVFVFSRVEGALVAMAAERHYADELGLLDETQRQIKRLAPKRGQPITQPYMDLVTDFHHQIHRMCHSKFAGERAIMNWKMLDFLLFNGGFGNIQGGKSLDIADKQRAEIVEAITKRDAAVAERLMEKHMRDKLNWLPMALKPHTNTDVPEETANSAERSSVRVLATESRRRR